MFEAVELGERLLNYICRMSERVVSPAGWGSFKNVRSFDVRSGKG